MYYTIYKANPSNSGCCASFRVSLIKNGREKWIPKLFVEFLPQKSWDDKSKTGTFDKEERKVVAFDINEAGEMLYSIEHNVPWSAFHKTQDGTTIIKFGFWNKKMSFGLPKEKGYWEGEKRNSAISFNSQGKSCSLPITSGETVVLKLLLESYIKQFITMAGKVLDKKFKKEEE